MEALARSHAVLPKDFRMSARFDLQRYEIGVETVIRNAAPARLYEDAIINERAAVVSSGALVVRSGAKTGRSPLDKRIVDHPASSDEIWWGPINIKLGEDIFIINRQRAIDYLNTRETIYVFDGFAGWDPKQRLKIRVICARAYHALFMHNMLLRPTTAELEAFGEPDYVIFNAGQFPANPHTTQMTSKTSIALSLERREYVILGTEYAGEMKKGIFTLMHYVLPQRGTLSMHCSANEGPAGDVSLFFGLSGTGKTTLSADPARRLIGDDEHGWSDEGVFNIEGGCYAKCIHLSAEKEPQIWDAIRFGCVLENVVVDPLTRRPDYDDARYTENTRAAYPVEFIPNCELSGRGGHPDTILFLTCDAFGVLPPLARLTPEQAMYHFLSGYTAKVAGTEAGVTEPQATFSTCFAAPFLPLHPARYADLLCERLLRHGSQVWLVNTGWTGGPQGQGSRIRLDYTRSMVRAILKGD